MNNRSKLLWIDSLGGLFVGLLVIALCRVLAEWHNLPLALIVVMGIANLLYGCFSLNLAVRSTRPMKLICILAVANIAWLLICCLLTAVWWTDVSVLGIVHLVGEGIYVAALGILEWRWRESLATGDSTIMERRQLN